MPRRGWDLLRRKFTDAYETRTRCYPAPTPLPARWGRVGDGGAPPASPATARRDGRPAGSRRLSHRGTDPDRPARHPFGISGPPIRSCRRDAPPDRTAGRHPRTGCFHTSGSISFHTCRIRRRRLRASCSRSRSDIWNTVTWGSPAGLVRACGLPSGAAPGTGCEPVGNRSATAPALPGFRPSRRPLHSRSMDRRRQ